MARRQLLRGRAPRFVLLDCPNQVLINPCYAIYCNLIMPFPCLFYPLLLYRCHSCFSMRLTTGRWISGLFFQFLRLWDFDFVQDSDKWVLQACNVVNLITVSSLSQRQPEKSLLRGRNSEGKCISTALEQEASDRLKCGCVLTLALGRGGQIGMVVCRCIYIRLESVDLQSCGQLWPYIHTYIYIYIYIYIRATENCGCWK